MLKKNYYELLGVSPNITKEQIWEEYERLRRKFFAEYPRARVSKKEKKESEDAFMIALGILTDIEERKRYDKHLKQFGSDENFPSDYDFAKGNFDKLASILIRVTEKEKELFETRENEKLKLTSEIRRILRDLISMGDKWKCECCKKTYCSLVFYSEELSSEKGNVNFENYKVCLSCFCYIQGKLVGEDYKGIGKNNELFQVMRKIEEKIWKRCWSLFRYLLRNCWRGWKRKVWFRAEKLKRRVNYSRRTKIYTNLKLILPKTQKTIQ